MKRKLLFDPILNKLTSHPVEPKPEGLVTSVNGILPDAGGNVLLPLERSGWMEIPSGENVVTFMVKNGPGLYLCNPRSTYTGGLPEGKQFETARTSYSTFLFITYRLAKMPAYYDYSTTEVYADLWLQMADLTANGYMAMAAWRGVACNEFFLTQANVSWRQMIDYDGEVFIRNDVRLEGNPMVEDLPADFDQLPEYFQNNRIVNKKYVDQKVGNEITNHFSKNNYITTINGLVPDENGNVTLPLERSGWMEIPSGENVVTFMVKNGPGLYLCNPRSTYTGGLPEGQKFEIARTSYSTFLFITYRLSKMPAYYDYSSTEVYADLWLQMADLTANGYMAMAAWRGVACNEFFLTQANVSWRQVIDYDGEVFIRNDVRLEGNPMVEDLPADFDQLPEYFQNNRIVNKKYVDQKVGDEITNHFLENNYITTINGLVPDENGNMTLPLGNEGVTEIPAGENVILYMFERGPGVYILNPLSDYLALPEEAQFGSRKDPWLNTFITYRPCEGRKEYDFNASFDFGDFLLEIFEIIPTGYKALAAFRRLAYKDFDLDLHVLPWQQLRGYNGDVIVGADLELKGNPTVEDLPANFEQLPEEVRKKRVVNKDYVDGLVASSTDIKVKVIPFDEVDPYEFMRLNGLGYYRTERPLIEYSGRWFNFPIKAIDGQDNGCCLIFEYKACSATHIGTSLIQEWYCRTWYPGVSPIIDKQLWRINATTPRFYDEVLKWEQLLDHSGHPVISDPSKVDITITQDMLPADIYALVGQNLADKKEISGEFITTGGEKCLTLQADDTIVNMPPPMGSFSMFFSGPSSEPVYISLDGATYRATKNKFGHVKLEFEIAKAALERNSSSGAFYLYTFGSTYCLETYWGTNPETNESFSQVIMYFKPSSVFANLYYLNN